MVGQKRNLVEALREEKEKRVKGGIYHATQVQFAYYSNRMEGSQLTFRQVNRLYLTDTLTFDQVNAGSPIKLDDILATVNHFQCFDDIVDNFSQPLTETLIKHLHKVLVNGFADFRKGGYAAGEYKTMPNVVGKMLTARPNEVRQEMERLLAEYAAKKDVGATDAVEFHVRFEAIHPFQDGNGRIGRLLLFKECLRHGIVPFIMTDEYANLYYAGLDS